MNSILCTICWSRKVIDMTGEEEIPKICDILYEVSGFQLPHSFGVCYICRHQLLKIYQFKGLCAQSCIHLQDYGNRDGCIDEKRPRNFQNFITTNTLKQSIDPYPECADENLYKQALDLELDSGYFTAVATHTFDSSDDILPQPFFDVPLLGTDHSHGHDNDIDEIKSNITIDNENSLQNDNECSESVKSGDYDNASNDIGSTDPKAEETSFEKIVLSIEEQKSELEASRKERKYLDAEYKCYSCALGFILKDSYQSHMVRHEESNGQYSCDTCGLRFAQSGVRSMHAALHSERYRCRRCGVCVKRARRRQHAARCHRHETAGCHHCGAMFQDMISLQQHLRRMHTRAGSKTYACVLCGKQYRDSSGLRVHMIKHSNKRFHCPRCPSSFNNPYSLNRHVSEHDGGRPVHCAPCDAWFKSRKTYRAHVRTAATHRTDSYECPHCGRACATKQSLEGHMQCRHLTTGASFACQLCPARYTSRKSLLRHVKIHGERPPVKIAVCHLCGKSYKGQNKLNRHLREVCEMKHLNEEMGE